MDASLFFLSLILLFLYYLACFFLKVLCSLGRMKTVCSRFLTMFSNSRKSMFAWFIYANTFKLATSSRSRVCECVEQIEWNWHWYGFMHSNPSFCFCRFYLLGWNANWNKMKIAKFFNRVSSLMYSKLNSSSFLNKVFIINTFGVTVFDSIFATKKVTAEWMWLFEKCVANWVSKVFEEAVVIIAVVIS